MAFIYSIFKLRTSVYVTGLRHVQSIIKSVFQIHNMNA